MTKRLGKRVAALFAAVLMCAGSLAVFAPSASAHTATKTGRVYECTLEMQMTRVVARGSGDSWVEGTVTYKPEYVSVCRWVTRQVPRPHIHISERTCRWVGAGGALAGGRVGGGQGAVLGGLAGYEVCTWLPKIIWLG